MDIDDPDPDAVEALRRMMNRDTDGITPDELAAAVELLCSIEDARRVGEMAVTFDLDPMPAVRDGEVVLYGFEGQVDAVWPVPNRPDVLRRLVPVKVSYLVDDPGPIEPTMRTAEYRRVGESTYVRFV